MTKTKVLHIITRLDRGGSSTNVIDTVNGLDRNFYKVDLISGLTYDPDQKIHQSLQTKNLKVIFVDSLRRNINPFYDFLAFIKLFNIIRKGHYDIVHTHSSKAGILGRWAAKLAGVPRIIHTPHGHVFYGYFNRWITNLFILIERFTALITDKIITLTNIGKQDHVKLKIAPLKKFKTIYSGIDIEKFKEDAPGAKSLREKYQIPAKSFVIGAVARLDEVKGNDYLIKAFAKVLKKHSDICLLLAGDGDQRSVLENFTRELGIEKKVFFIGFSNDVNAVYSLIDIFVLASLNEGMGRVILEAMAFSKPIIATRVGGIPELIEDQTNGLLVPCKNSEYLAEAIMILLADPKLRTQLGIQAKKKVNEKFSLGKMIHDIDHLYRNVRHLA